MPLNGCGHASLYMNQINSMVPFSITPPAGNSTGGQSLAAGPEKGDRRVDCHSPLGDERGCTHPEHSWAYNLGKSTAGTWKCTSAGPKGPQESAKLIPPYPNPSKGPRRFGTTRPLRKAGAAKRESGSRQLSRQNRHPNFWSILGSYQKGYLALSGTNSKKLWGRQVGPEVQSGIRSVLLVGFGPWLVPDCQRGVSQGNRSQVSKEFRTYVKGKPCHL